MKLKLTGIGIISYLLLAFLAIVFYKERVIMLDMAFHTFEIVRSKSFAIQSERVSAVFTQFFPWLAVTIHASLKNVLITYSVSFIIFPFIIFLLSIYLFRNSKIALAVLLFSTLIVTHTFFWIQSELIQGAIFLLLYFAFLIDKNAAHNLKWWDYLLMALMSFLIISYHPLIVFPFMFGIFYFLLSPNLVDKKLLFHAFISIACIGLLKVILFPPGKYEHGKMSGLKFFIKLFPDYFTIPVNFQFLESVVTEYYFLPVFLVGLTLFYLKRKQYYKLALVHLFFWGYLLLVNISNSNWYPKFYMESYYLIMGFFVILPFVFDVLEEVKNQNLAYFSIGIIVLAAVFRIYNASSIYENRVASLEAILKKTEHLESRKLVLNESSVPMKDLVVSWGSSYEFLLLSSLDNSTSARSIIILKDFDKYDSLLNKNNVLFTEWYSFPYRDLPEEYFNFCDTSCYKKLK